MTLPEYIQAIGNEAACRLFSAKLGTIKSWRYGYREPSTESARRIIAATGGKVAWEDIYHDSADKAQKSNLVTNKESH